MRLCWFDEFRFGVVVGDDVCDVTPVLELLPPAVYPTPPGDPVIANLERLRPAIQEMLASAPRKPRSAVRLRCPVGNPGKIVATPVNYLKHVEEVAAQRHVFTDARKGTITDQGLFLKSVSGLIGCDEPVRVRFPERRTDHEIELGVVIGKPCANVSEADALNYVAGYAIALDMVVRGSEDRSFRKSIDTYSVLGPWLVTADEISNPDDLDFEILVNGVSKQRSSTKSMILSVSQQIAWASAWYTLWPGDIIMTGTCEGVSQVVPGDTMNCTINGIGSMNVAVSAAEPGVIRHQWQRAAH
jgi:2-keto-4-pentenoate hydratase/2-oxohepta-3-ene-1,7-dioic acid hydratase in catechol pathway